MMAWNGQPWLGALSVDWIEIGILAACVLVGLLAVAAWGLCAWAGWTGLRKKQQAVFPLRLTSKSNLQTSFQLRVELGELQKSVSAFWLQEGHHLPGKTIKHYSYVEAPLPQRQPQAAAAKTPRPVKQPSKEKKAAQEGMQKVNVVSNLVANITGTLASLLPGPLKTPFRAVHDAIREQQKSVLQVKAEADRLNSSTRALNRSVNRLGKEAGVNASAAQGQTQAGKQETESGQKVVVTEIPITETDAFAPAQSSVCKLVIRPRNPLRSLSGSFQVTTQPVELKAFPLYGTMPSQTLSADLQIRAARLYSGLLAVLLAAAGALCAWGSITLIRWLLLFR